MLNIFNSLLLTASILLIPNGCTGGTKPSGNSSPTTINQQWTVGIVEKKRDDIGPVTVKNIRTGQHAGYERIVFDFEGRAVPGYRIEYVDRPVRQCGSGEPVALAGDAWLHITLSPSQAHDGNGNATIKNRERKTGYKIIKELKFTCDFEAQVAVALGLSSPNRFRVLELSNPTRLVIDIKDRR
jgi:hypothetical protein